MKRTFISIELSENVKKEIEKIQEKLPEFKGKKTELENLHLTLKFLGEIDDWKIEEVKKRLKTFSSSPPTHPFETGLDKIGVFSEEYIRIVWVHLTNCEELQKEIDKVLDGLFEPEKRFMGHITIARVKNVEDKEKFLEDLKGIEIKNVKFKIDKFYLKESKLFPEGPRYFVIGEYDL